MFLLPDHQVHEVLRNLSPQQCHHLLRVLATALRLYSSERSAYQEKKLLHQPLRSSFVTANHDTSLVMPSSDSFYTGVKVVTLPAAGGISGIMLIQEAAGKPLGLLGATQLTAFRTALAAVGFYSRVVESQLQPASGSSCERIVIFGAGNQVEWHMRLALLLLRGGNKNDTAVTVRNITVINRSRQRLDQLEKDVLSILRPAYPGVQFRLVAKEDMSGDEYERTLQAALAASDAIFCCTPSTKPLFPFRYLEAYPKTRYVSMIGSYKPHMKEVDTATLLSGADGVVYVDSKEACLEESGELIEAECTKARLVEVGEVYGNEDVKAFMSGSNIVFKCVGMGIMDLAVGKALLEIAKNDFSLENDMEGF